MEDNPSFSSYHSITFWEPLPASVVQTTLMGVKQVHWHLSKVITKLLISPELENNISSASYPWNWFTKSLTLLASDKVFLLHQHKSPILTDCTESKSSTSTAKSTSVLSDCNPKLLHRSWESLQCKSPTLSVSYLTKREYISLLLGVESCLYTMFLSRKLPSKKLIAVPTKLTALPRSHSAKEKQALPPVTDFHTILQGLFSP